VLATWKARGANEGGLSGGRLEGESGARRRTSSPNVRPPPPLKKEREDSLRFAAHISCPVLFAEEKRRNGRRSRGDEDEETTARSLGQNNFSRRKLSEIASPREFEGDGKNVRGSQGGNCDE